MHDRGDLIRYVRSHHGTGFLVGTVLLAVVNAALGAQTLALPSAVTEGGTNDLPLRNDIPIVIAALLVGGLNGPMRDFEMTAAGILRSAMRWQLATGLGIALLIGVGAEYAMMGPEIATRYLRSTLIWTGLALISGRLLGMAMAWLIPVASTFPLMYYGDRQWWDWTTAPAYSPMTWGVAIASLIVGIAAFETTSWMWHNARHRA